LFGILLAKDKMAKNNALLLKFKTCLAGIKSDKNSLDQGYFENEISIDLPENIASQRNHIVC